MAFHQACDQDQIDTAEHLLRALELTVTNYGGPGVVDRRDIESAVVEAYQRLQSLKARALEAVGSPRTK
jgi:hypothetical protein